MTNQRAIILLSQMYLPAFDEEEKQAIDKAIEALTAQEPRMMTEQEMRDAEPGAVIYCEQRDEVRTYLTPLIKYDDGMFENRFLGAVPEAAQLPNIRFWTSRPTDAQREATPWQTPSINVSAPNG